MVNNVSRTTLYYAVLISIFVATGKETGRPNRCGQNEEQQNFDVKGYDGNCIMHSNTLCYVILLHLVSSCVFVTTGCGTGSLIAVVKRQTSDAMNGSINFMSSPILYLIKLQLYICL